MPTYICTLEVRGYELDSFGHVNHSVYLNYLEHARWKMLNEEGITLSIITQLQRWPVIAHVDIRYLRPVYMGDTLEIRTRCIEHGRASFVFEQKAFCQGKQVLEAKVTSVVVNAEGRPASVPVEYEALWKNGNPQS